MFRNFFVTIAIVVSSSQAFGDWYYVNGPYETCRDGSLPSREESEGGISYVCWEEPSTPGWYLASQPASAVNTCPEGYELVYYSREQEYMCEAWLFGPGEQFSYTYVYGPQANCPVEYPNGPFREESYEGIYYYCMR